MSQKQDICAICTEPFKFKEIVIDIERWEHETLKAHLDCALYMSMVEDGRSHPPLRD